MDDIECSECGAEPGDPTTAADDGWDLEGEFGARCPECVVGNAAPAQAVGLDALAAVAGVEKKEAP